MKAPKTLFFYWLNKLKDFLDTYSGVHWYMVQGSDTTKLP